MADQDQIAQTLNHSPWPNTTRQRLKRSSRRRSGSSPGERTAGFVSVHYNSPENPASRAIIEGREATTANSTVGIEEIIKLYTEILGQEDHSSPDERFMRIVNGS